jgi:hypothetical protein
VRTWAVTGSPSFATTVGQQKLALKTALPSTGWNRKGKRRHVSGLRAPPSCSWMRHRFSAERNPQAPSARLRMRKWPAWPPRGSKGSTAPASVPVCSAISALVYQAAAPAFRYPSTSAAVTAMSQPRRQQRPHWAQVKRCSA